MDGYSEYSILQSVIKYYKITKQQLLTPATQTTDNQHVAIYLLHKYSDVTTTLLGQMFNKNRTTINRAVKRIEELVNNSPDYKEQVNKILQGATDKKAEERPATLDEQYRDIKYCISSFKMFSVPSILIEAVLDNLFNYHQDKRKLKNIDLENYYIKSDCN
jgi:predicted transcriptional regulator